MGYNVDLDLTNKGAFSKSGLIDVRETASSAAKVIYQTSDFAGILTGKYLWRSVEGTWYEVIALSTNYLYGYVLDRDVDIKIVNPIQYNTSQGIITQMIENDKQSLTNLLICAQYCKLLSEKGYNVTTYMSQIKNTYLSLYNRNQKLKKSPGFSDKTYGTNTLTSYAPALTSIVNNPSIGLILTTGAIVAIIIAAVVAGAVATAVYYGFKNESENAERDLKISDDLKSVLENVDPEVRQRILSDLENQIDEAYKAGKRSGLSWWDIIKYGGVAFGTFFIVRYIKNTF